MDKLSSAPQIGYLPANGAAGRPLATAPNATAGATVSIQPADKVKLAQQVNPFQGIGNGTERVSVDRWRKGPNDSIEHILRNQGFSMDEIYSRRGKSPSLIERVAQANGLKDPNLVRPGRSLIVPSKTAKEDAPAAQQTRPEAQAEVKPEAKPDAKPEVKPEVKPEPQAEVKPEVKPEAQTQGETQGETKPAKKGRRRFIFFGPRVKPKAPKPEVQVNEQPPAQTAPEVKPEATTTTTTSGEPARTLSEGEANNVEVNLLLKGVNDGKFTRNEFQALNATANQFVELRARYAKDNYTPQQTATLAQVQHQYGQMYARFLADDNAKVTFRSNANNADSQFRAQQNDEGGRLYDDYLAKRISEQALTASLVAQRERSSQLGTR